MIVWILTRRRTRAFLILCLQILAAFAQIEDRALLVSSIDHSANDLRMQEAAEAWQTDIPLPIISISEKVSQGIITQEGLDGAVYERPLQLLKPAPVAGQQDRFELNMMTVEKLAAITDPISVVSAVGPYHGGKSFLLNVLLNSTRGFDVGSVPEPETRGIWLRLVPKHKVHGTDGSMVMLLDTEGFYGEGATRSYDARVFALATLLSSHLVYNTLRTIGDAQSVSALADLAKQAQVFNLQNWLHTGDANSDDASTPVDVDPVLLLKTLKFPPLTWVVQGFDIGLHSSHTPTDYLERYLAAHAHRGDRTLDTLFTQGIKCYTMRTPTDLNLLREVVGDEGLAAEEELFPYLHPGYVGDVQALQSGIFGNLAAKGGLTGKDLAGLLPILVHYVNEDFPLHAERKLRDVLVDLVVDGAFSGGVQYFQLCMRTFPDKDKLLSARRGREVDAALARLKSADDGVRLSALADSAFATEELEQLLDAAEMRAIEYCKKRNVGVPSERSEIACEGQLAVKIDRMKQRYRDENDGRVKEVLVILGHGFREAAEREVDGLALPMHDRDIQHRCKESIRDATQGYDVLVGPHRGGHLYREARARMENEIHAKCDKVSRINAEKISAILSRGKDAYSLTYQETILKHRCGLNSSEVANQASHQKHQKPCSRKRLAEISKFAQAEAQLQFDKAIQAEELPWLGPGVEQYDFQVYQCAQWSKRQYAELQEQNEARIMKFCEDLTAALLSHYKEEATKIVPFPDNDEALMTKTQQLILRLLADYDERVRDFQPSSAAEDKKTEMIRGMDELTEYQLRKNTALMRAFCYDPLHDAYKELRLQDCERTFNSMWRTKGFWSRKCLWPGPKYAFGLKYAAYMAARKHLELAQSASTSSALENSQGVVLSAAMRNKVIESWIQQDLGYHTHLVFVNFALLVTLGFIGVASCAWIYSGFSKPLKRSKVRFR